MSRSTYKVLQGPTTTHCSSHRGGSSTSSACANHHATNHGVVDPTNQETKECSPVKEKNDQKPHLTSSCTTPLSSKTTCQSPPTSSLGVGTTPQGSNSIQSEEQRRAAAAEARRKRRLLLTRRQNSTSPRRSSRSRRGVTIVPFAGARTTTPTTTASTPTASSAVALRPNRCCYPLIQPTIEGVESVATRWKNGFVVAIPTECTYEACLALNVPARTGTQQQLQGSMEEWLQSVEQLRNITKSHSDLSPSDPTQVQDPYCLVTPGCELKRHPILRDVFTPRLYALRPSDVDKNAVLHRFNESMEVLERLASKLWPGPILIRLGLSSSSPWTRTPFVVESRPPTGIRIDHEDEENDPNNNHVATTPVYKNFITLRCPRHPLAVKARKDVVTSNDNCLLVSLPIHHSAQAAATDTSRMRDDETEFCTRARQVASRMAVLDGEDCREVFHVPTCEYRRPCESILWLDGRQRTVTIQSTLPEVCNKSMVQAALRHFASKHSAGCNKKERMLTQAIISKWRVVTCTPEVN